MMGRLENLALWLIYQHLTASITQLKCVLSRISSVLSILYEKYKWECNQTGISHISSPNRDNAYDYARNLDEEYGLTCRDRKN